ncbi:MULTISPECIES: hypothetical protein [Pseudophaeobacter]|jgi:hypothetical protein|uniref:hypothetical protein n=1 Tax=Pseudophaeobacter TaxID=1541822 RepID=UPI00242E6BE9|nr:hypothetical protein [Pseudophaeobacter profundi]
MNMQNRGFGTSLPILSDEEIEAQVFRKLEAAQKVERERAKECVVLFQYPDNRTVFQRWRAWWHVRQTRAVTKTKKQAPDAGAEPVWTQNRATIKYR